MIISIGYRVKSKTALMFRKWATKKLKQILIKGYSVDEERCLECKNSILELKTKVLEIEQRQQHQITYFKGEELRGFVEIKRFLETATKEIIIFDNYFGHEYDEVLDKLKVKK